MARITDGDEVYLGTKEAFVSGLLVRYGVALHLAVLAIYASWARGGSAPAFFWAIPWLALGVIEMMFLLPPMHEGDSVRAAVRRVWRGILRDPVFYIGLALILFLALQWLNGPREMTYNAGTAAWEYTPPPWPGFPFCVVRSEAAQVLIWAVGVCAILLTMRHGGMRRDLKRWLLKVIVFNGAILAAVGLAHLATGTDKLFGIRPIGTFFFSTFGYPNHAGAYFTLVTAINIGLVMEVLGGEEHTQSSSGWLQVALVLNLLGVFFSLCRAGMVLTLAILAFAAVYGTVYLWNRLAVSAKLRLLTLVAGLVLFAAFMAVKAPGNPILREIKSIEWLRLHEQLQGDRAELGRAAVDIWQDYPWSGTGGWGFRRFVGMYMGPEKYDYLRAAGRANVHNDALQYLCEHGMIGMVLILGLILVVVGQIVIRLTTIPRLHLPESGLPRTWFMSVNPLVWFILVGTTATVIHSLIDLPFRNMAILSVWFIALAAAPGFLPRKPKSKPAASRAPRENDDELRT